MLKYDLRFSAVKFFALAAIALGAAAVMSFTAQLSETAQVGFVVLSVGALILTGLGIAAIVEIFRFYSHNLFGKAGYLTLTLPAGRGVQLASKIIVSVVWFIFALIVTIVALYVVVVISDGMRPSYIMDVFSATILANILNLIFIAIFAICLMFFCITLANSVFRNKRVHAVISGIVGFVIGIVHSRVQNVLSTRSWGVRHFTQNLMGEPSSWYGSRPLVGWQYGRIPLQPGNQFSAFIDIFQIGATIAMCALLVAATCYLLNKRIALK